MGRGKDLTMNEKSEIVRLFEGGATISEMAENFNDTKEKSINL